MIHNVAIHNTLIDKLGCVEPAAEVGDGRHSSWIIGIVPPCWMGSRLLLVRCQATNGVGLMSDTEGAWVSKGRLEVVEDSGCRGSCRREGWGHRQGLVE